MPINTTTPPTVKLTTLAPVVTITTWNIPWIAGARIDFESPVESVTALNGEIVVRSNATVRFKVFPESFLQVTPGYADIWRGGMMKNPSDLSNYSDPSYGIGEGTGGQGADGLAGTTYPSAAINPYIHSKNVDSGATGTWVTVAAGESASFQKAFIVPGSKRPATQWQSVQEYVAITFMPTLPSGGPIRPAVGPTTKVSPGNLASIDFSVLRNFTAPSGAPLLGTNTRIMPRHILSYLMGGQDMRRMHPKVQDDYATYFAEERIKELFTLMWSATNAQKSGLFYKSITNGHDMCANFNFTGWAGRGGAGQNGGRFPLMALAGFALQDQALVDIAFAHRSNALSQVFTGRAALVGWPTGWPFNPNDANEQRWNQPVLPEHIGRAHWINEPETGNPTRISTHHNTRYWGQNYASYMMENLFVMCLQNGPNGQTGLDQMVASGHSQILQLFDEMAAWTLGNMPPQWVLDTWTLLKVATPSYVPWTGTPTQPANSGYLAAGVAAGSCDWTSTNLSTLAVTDRLTGFSIDDGKSWFEESVFPATSGTKTGLLRGVYHFGRFRNVNAAGPGLPSLTAPLSSITSSGAYTRMNTFTTAGTGTNAIPVFSAPAKLIFEPTPIAGCDVFRDCPATLPAGVTRVYVGFGYPVGWPIPTLSYQFKSNGVDIGGASGSGFIPGAIPKYAAFLDIPSTVAGTTLTVTVTATNSQGSANSTSAGVAVPGTQKRAGIVARGQPGVQPDGWTKRWGSGTFINAFDVYGRVTNSVLKSRGGTAGNNFWAAATLPLIGSMANVPEGDAIMFGTGSLAGSDNCDAGIWFRCTGANEAAANGYYLGYFFTKSTSQMVLKLYRVVAGVRTIVATSADITNIGFKTWFHLRVNWDIVGADLIIKGKMWRNPFFGKTPYLDDAEPVTWNLSYTDNAPLTSGEPGIGTIATNRDRDVGYTGFSTDPTLPAFLQPPYA